MQSWITLPTDANRTNNKRYHNVELVLKYESTPYRHIMSRIYWHLVASKNTRHIIEPSSSELQCGDVLEPQPRAIVSSFLRGCCVRRVKQSDCERRRQHSTPPTCTTACECKIVNRYTYAMRLRGGLHSSSRFPNLNILRRRSQCPKSHRPIWVNTVVFMFCASLSRVTFWTL